MFQILHKQASTVPAVLRNLVPPCGHRGHFLCSVRDLFLFFFLPQFTVTPTSVVLFMKVRLLHKRRFIAFDNFFLENL